MEFFSLRANTWIEIEGTQFTYRNIMDIEQPAAGKLFNMHLPVNFDRELRNFGLWVFGEFLGLWIEYDYDSDNNDDDFIYSDRLEVWVMKECKVDSPWTKTIVLNSGYSPKCYPLICSTKSGYIIGTNGGTVLAKYNDQGQFLEHHSYYNDRCGCEVALYVESLISLPGNEQA
ncbi:F-box protein [Trifolium medium]|uniref:F-box protein n=1 Tax=Trifolium medium TaxID=97028 RepID=A0A392MLQ1_9FABA|nr:F-box protein [Trifolium medium]